MDNQQDLARTETLILPMLPVVTKEEPTTTLKLLSERFRVAIQCVTV